ncbi:hypothetical protein K438DRAFT_1522058, partial [Mycena galopus ATCC 62051]
RYNTLLRTNEPPLESEVPYIRSLVSAAAARLAIFHKEILPLQLHQELVKQDYAELLSFYDQHYGAISPLRRMPNELLQEIFFWSLPSVQDSKYSKEIQMQDSPWILTHICQKWRALAINTPGLWSIIAINY